jgi:hypothetical protein
MKVCLDSYWTLVGLIHQLSVTTVKAFDDFISDVKADVFYRGFSCIRLSAPALLLLRHFSEGCYSLCSSQTFARLKKPEFSSSQGH